MNIFAAVNGSRYCYRWQCLTYLEKTEHTLGLIFHYNTSCILVNQNKLGEKQHPTLSGPHRANTSHHA